MEPWHPFPAAAVQRHSPVREVHSFFLLQSVIGSLFRVPALFWKFSTDVCLQCSPVRLGDVTEQLDYNPTSSGASEQFWFHSAIVRRFVLVFHKNLELNRFMFVDVMFSVWGGWVLLRPAVNEWIPSLQELSHAHFLLHPRSFTEHGTDLSGWMCSEQHFCISAT